MRIVNRVQRTLAAGWREKGVLPAYLGTAAVGATSLVSYCKGDDAFGHLCATSASLLSLISFLHHYSMGSFALKRADAENIDDPLERYQL